MRGFKLPIIMNIPPEVNRDMSELAEQDTVYEELKQTSLKKTYENPKSKIRKIGDYLLMNYSKGAISYEEISKILGISENGVKLRVTHLNFYKHFPLTMIPVPKMKGYIQSCLRSDTDYENWDLKKQRTIVSMEQVRTKAKKITKAKENTTEKQKVKIEVRNEN